MKRCSRPTFVPSTLPHAWLCVSYGSLHSRRWYARPACLSVLKIRGPPMALLRNRPARCRVAFSGRHEREHRTTLLDHSCTAVTVPKEPVDGSSHRREQSRLAIWKSDENLVLSCLLFNSSRRSSSSRLLICCLRRDSRYRF